MTDSEKRHFRRFPLQAQAEIHSAGGSYRSELLDVSLKGALMSRPNEWRAEANSEHELVFYLTDSDVAIRMAARVAHSEDDHIGFHCVNIDIGSMSELRRLVELNLGEHSLLERELSELSAN
jgi:hypothetical protein